ncbi:MAG: VanZ family protein [Prevotellaceae bacterium]|jgi:VanZ family protein|nr:VanZ family protein [Prevotellaceae bacterium]
MYTFKRYIIVSTIALAVVMLSVIPVTSLPDAGGIFLDKMVHTVMYAGLTLAFCFDLTRNSNRRLTVKQFVGVFLFGVIFGLIIELLQSVIPYRSADFQDCLANAIGAFIGSCTGKYIFKPNKKVSPQ